MPERPRSQQLLPPTDWMLQWSCCNPDRLKGSWRVSLQWTQSRLSMEEVQCWSLRRQWWDCEWYIHLPAMCKISQETAASPLDLKKVLLSLGKGLSYAVTSPGNAPIDPLRHIDVSWFHWQTGKHFDEILPEKCVCVLKKTFKRNTGVWRKSSIV